MAIYIFFFIVVKSAQLNGQVPVNFTYFQDYNEIKTCFPRYDKNDERSILLILSRLRQFTMKLKNSFTTQRRHLRISIFSPPYFISY